MVFLPASQLFFLLIPICSVSVVSTARSSPGILVIGGESSSASQSVEFWSPANPEEGSCELSDYPRKAIDGPTANLVSGQLVACYEYSCEIYNNGQWDQLTETWSYRWYHSSAVKEDRILLIGGDSSRSTEWISADGSPSEAGPFDVRHGHFHCTMQLSADLIVVTGGDGTESYVTEYQLTGNNSNETPLTPMRQGRYGHACGAYQGAAGQQVLFVTGGRSGSGFLSSTEVTTYSSGGQLEEWREVEGGELPSPRVGLQATLVGDILFVTGGVDDNNVLTSILSWDPVAESWQEAGDLAVARYTHAVVAVPTSTVAKFCRK